MRLYLFLFCYHQFIFTIIALSTINQNNSPINVDLYQCDSNTTLFNNTIIPNDRTFTNLINSCNINCCKPNGSSRTVPWNVCQVTVQSSTNICLGRLCYSGKCDSFVLLANKTREEKLKNTTTLITTIRSSLGHSPWSSVVNSTQTKWTSWIDKSSSAIRQTILIILLITSISLSFMALILVIKSIRHAKNISDRKAYRYSLL